MELVMKVNIIFRYNVEKVFRYIRMDKDMKDIGKVEKRMVKVFKYLLMEINIKDIGKMV